MPDTIDETAAKIDGLINTIPASFLLDNDLDEQPKEFKDSKGKTVQAKHRMFDPALCLTTVEYLAKYLATPKKPQRIQIASANPRSEAIEKSEKHANLKEKLHAKIRAIQEERKNMQSARARAEYEAYVEQKKSLEPDWKSNPRKKQDRPSMDEFDEETKQKWVAERAVKDAAKAKRQRQEEKAEKAGVEKAPKKQKKPEPVVEEDIGENIEFSSMQFKTNKADAPFETWVNKPGTKAKRLAQQIAAAEKAEQELEDKKAAMNQDDLKDFENQQKLEKAMQRAGGVKVRDDLKRLKKTQKTIQKKKSESMVKWSERKTNQRDQLTDRLERRDANIERKRDKKSKKRPGFEGKEVQDLNKKPKSGQKNKKKSKK